LFVILSPVRRCFTDGSVDDSDFELHEKEVCILAQSLKH